MDNNQTQSSTLPSPYSISSPERTEFYSFCYNNSSNNTDTTKDEFNLFSPLSFSNSSVSSFTDSILNQHITPPPSPMLPMATKNDKSSISAPTKSSIEEFASALIERCTHLIDLMNTTKTTDDATAPDGMDFSHVREMELLSNQTMILIDACDESLCLQDIRPKIQKEDFFASIKTTRSFVSLLIVL